VRLLDTPHVRIDGQRHNLPHSAPALVLVCLAMQADWLPRERLMALFWPDAADTAAQHHLRVTLHRSKLWLQGLGLGAHLHTERSRLRLQLPCDVPQMRAAVGRADWATAVALHRAPLLAGASLKGFAAVDQWLALERDALVTAWRNAALRQAPLLEAVGDAVGAATLLQQQLTHDLLAEDVVQALLRVAAAAGQRSTALDTFERFAQRMQGELGLQPLAGTLALAAALRQAPAAATSPAPSAPAGGLQVGLAGGPVTNPLTGGVASAASDGLPRPPLPPGLLAPPLSGRQAELAAVRLADAGLVLVCGEPGVGKSRLLAEALVAHEPLWLHCHDGLQDTPLLPVLEALQTQSSRLLAAVPEATERRMLARLLPALQPLLAPGEVLGPADADTPRLLATLVGLLQRLSPVLVVDDLQWADTATLAVLRLLAAGAGGAPARLYATLRMAEAPPEVQSFVANQEAAGRLHRCDLAPLAAADMADLMQQLAGAAAPRFAAWLHGRSGGNPFFALETLRALFEAGQLRAAPGAPGTNVGWASDLDALSTDYQELHVPPRVAALVRRRVDGLADTTRRVLSIAAVAGDALHLELLAQVAGLSPWATGEALAAAQTAGLLNGRHFAHDLVREALLRATPEPLQTVLHAGVARHCADVLPPHRLAGHWWAAGNLPAALQATLAAAGLDQQRGLHASAQALLSAAQARTQDAAWLARLRAQRARVALETNDTDAALRLATDALAGLPTPDTRVKALVVLADVALLQGRLDDAATLQAQIAEVDADCSEAVHLACKLAYYGGRFDEVVALMGGRVRQLRREAPGLELVSALTSLGSGHDGAGRFEQGAACHAEAMHLARQLGTRYAEVESALNLMYSLPELGRRDEAIALGETALALGDYDATPYLLNNLAVLYFGADRLDEAAPLYQRLADGAEPTLRCYAWAKLVAIHTRQGRADKARAAIEAGLAALPGTQVYGAHAIVLEAVLLHGDAADVPRTRAWLRDEPLDSQMQQRMAVALARHGLGG
jgi:DNA-binding SARP family transcriptional activator/tetratricopeptide (TPR) repeat protein